MISSPGISLSDTKKNIQDLENAKRLYEAFKGLSPLQANTRYLCSYLSHVNYREYVINRWISSHNNEDSGEGVLKRIKNRFFVTDKKSLIRMNAISRLWWAGYLTCDENNSADKYHLTRTLFTGQQISADLLDTPFCVNKDVVKWVSY
ncbi:hypothetical protein Emin_0869 [Elusimicrobium minutum Pei191]|uniref:Uncharacterized protein n=1 Tax=Elusimicrobium minutum (strain Pei191) TaxID=445932 RepID=B2KD28_ELUMP|nr:DUF6339 family protein [Elusimicrobium minutum]ACC98424.1 hypothetical protein Emin_0869 [Elusimicrobium minutum Pei191]